MVDAGQDELGEDLLGSPALFVRFRWLNTIRKPGCNPHSYDLLQIFVSHLIQVASALLFSKKSMLLIEQTSEMRLKVVC